MTAATLVEARRSILGRIKLLLRNLISLRNYKQKYKFRKNNVLKEITMDNYQYK